ncbi:MAG: type II secretion system protein [Candidatus Brocadiaceae bacterium]|jgi:hypothetical protein
MRKGFSVTELLVVMCIVAAMAGLLLPALGQARLRARRSQCLNNVHQVGLGYGMYLVDFGNEWPCFDGRSEDAGVVFAVLATDYLEDIGVFNCPFADRYFADWEGEELVHYDYWQDPDIPVTPADLRGVYGDAVANHDEGSHLLCADGHVVWCEAFGADTPNADLRDDPDIYANDDLDEDGDPDDDAERDCDLWE